MRSRSPSMSIHSKCETTNATASHESVKRPISVQQRPTTPSPSSPRTLYALRSSGIELQQHPRGLGDGAGQPWITGSLELWMIACFATMAMMVSLDALIMVAALTKISKIYHSNYPRDATWPITTYFLLNIPMQRLAIAATDIISRRNVLIAGIAIFAIGVILLSTTPIMFPILLVGRGLQGLGAGIMVSVAPSMMTEMIPPQRRSRYYCVIFFSATVGAGIGPVLGGMFLEDQGLWRWIYYISAPFCFILLILTPLVIRPVGENLGPKMSILGIDWTGVCLFSASLTVLLLSINWMGIPNHATDWRTLLALVASVIGLIGTAVYEWSGASKPLLSFKILRTSPITFVCIFIHSLVMFTQLFYVPEFLRGVYELSPRYVGALLVPLTATSLMVTAVVGVITAKFRAYRWAVWSGWGLNIVSTGYMTSFNTDTSQTVCVIVLIVAGLGHGLTMSASHTAIQRLAASSDVRDASLLSNFIRTVGICVAVAAAGTAFQARFNSHLFRSDIPGLLGNLGFNEAFWRLPKIHIPAEIFEERREVYALAFRDIMLASTVLAGLGGLLSLCLGWRRSK